MPQRVTFLSLVWSQVRQVVLVWRPALTICAVMLALGACRQWDPVAEKVITPAAATPQRTAPPQSQHRAHSLAARSD
jgi:hypothetical protein